MIWVIGLQFFLLPITYVLYLRDWFTKHLFNTVPMYPEPLHRFHIPVMGLAFTIDSPVKVARFGISSVVSIIEDRLNEMMRKQLYELLGEPYQPISINEPDFRARRITDYLNLLDRIVRSQTELLKNSAFEPGTDLVKYFEMLPDESRLKKLYREMMETKDSPEKEKLRACLRSKVIAGSIDVNIMTKTDRNNHTNAGALIEDGSDAVAALRGYANSNLCNSSVVFSAGMNPRLYNYLEKLDQFHADENGSFRKKIIVKVSDYRSALVQGKYLAKKGIWVSEFRVESGLNCGGHAFATDGFLLGPILEEFKQKKQELISAMFTLYASFHAAANQPFPPKPPVLNLSVQGGIGTFEEASFLHQHYDITSTGWGSPFLLVPEATTVDDDTLSLLAKAKTEDLVLSNNSPLGVPFHYLKGTTAHKEKLERIKKGRPGSPCTEKHLAFNTEFTDEPICTASHKYQKLKIAELESKRLPPNEAERELSAILDKECLCVGLSNAASVRYEQPFLKHQKAVTVCPGPNIAWFNKIVSLQTMTDHIYGRTNIIEAKNRDHMFIAELNLYITYLRSEIEKEEAPDAKRKKYFIGFSRSLLEGISYYRELKEAAKENRPAFELALNRAENHLLDLINEKGLN